MGSRLQVFSMLPPHSSLRKEKTTSFLLLLLSLIGQAKWDVSDQWLKCRVTAPKCGRSWHKLKKKNKTMTYAKSKIGVVIHNYISNWCSTKISRQLNEENTAFLTSGSGTLDVNIKKKMGQHFCSIQYENSLVSNMKIISEWIINLHSKGKNY